MRRMIAVGFALLFLSPGASAQTATKGNISFGYFVRQREPVIQQAAVPTISSSNLNGWFTSAEYKPIPWSEEFSILAATTDERVTPFCE